MFLQVNFLCIFIYYNQTFHVFFLDSILRISTESVLVSIDGRRASIVFFFKVWFPQTCYIRRVRAHLLAPFSLSSATRLRALHHRHSRVTSESSMAAKVTPTLQHLTKKMCCYLFSYRLHVITDRG